MTVTVTAHTHSRGTCLAREQGGGRRKGRRRQQGATGKKKNKTPKGNKIQDTTCNKQREAAQPRDAVTNTPPPLTLQLKVFVLFALFRFVFA
jgi:hypothetical protein